MENKCVCCGVDIPEGRQVCVACEEGFGRCGFEVDIEFFTSPSPGFRINESYTITKKKDILEQLEQIHDTREYKDICEAGYDRTLKSEYQEWRAHNVLYKLGIARKRTGSVDIDQSEPKWRRVIYAILSIF